MAGKGWTKKNNAKLASNRNIIIKQKIVNDYKRFGKEADLKQNQIKRENETMKGKNILLFIKSNEKMK